MGKRKAPEPEEERRRPLPEINLLQEARPRPEPNKRARGCIQIGGLFVLTLGALGLGLAVLR